MFPSEPEEMEWKMAREPVVDLGGPEPPFKIALVQLP